MKLTYDSIFNKITLSKTFQKHTKDFYFDKKIILKKKKIYHQKITFGYLCLRTTYL